MRLPSLKIFLSVIYICICGLLSAQYSIPPKPAVLYPVYDEANILSATEKNALNDKLIKYADSTSTEIEVIIIPSTKGEDINFLATMFGEKWAIGKKGIDNGVVFLIAIEDRTMAIQQGRAVEQYLTASVAGQIIDYIVAPHFKQGNYYEGINRGTSSIIEALQGKFKAINNVDAGGDDLGISGMVLIFIVVMIIIFIISRNGGGGRGGNYNDDDVIISRRGRRSYPGGFFPFPGSFGGGGFGGGSGGGGGFGGFGGGGSFGGGGASGGW